MANTLKLLRNGAVGFIDWLGCRLDMTSQEGSNLSLEVHGCLDKWKVTDALYHIEPGTACILSKPLQVRTIRVSAPDNKQHWHLQILNTVPEIICRKLPLKCRICPSTPMPP